MKGLEHWLYEENYPFTRYTIEKYNSFLNEFDRDKKSQPWNVLILSFITSQIFTGGPIINSVLDAIVNNLKYFWIPPTLYFARYNIHLTKLNRNDFQIDLKNLQSNKQKLKEKHIIFQITTNGKNLETVKESAASCIYWTKIVEEKYDIKFNKEFLIVTEEDSYRDKRSFYEKFKEYGVKILAVPKEYETRRKTKFKARALHYTSEIIKNFDIDLKNCWSYKLDDDTVIGEDTVLGINSFCINSEAENKRMGMGLILYDRGWDKSGVLNIEESIRTHDDFSVYGEMKLLGYSFNGCHGSHFIVRSDTESEIGWDFGPTRAEDLLFIKILREKYGRNSVGILPGFAHEQPPYSIKDFLKQRRRWVKGNFDVLKSDLIGLRSKLEILYCLTNWYMAFPAFLATLSTLLHPTGSFHPYLGFSAGLTWASLFNIYRYGYKINSKYVDDNLKNEGIFKKVGKAVIGSLLESIAPWYGLFTKSSGFDVIDKRSKAS
ncbi:MAG: glycosyltransferase family 2 protein [Candidatus Aenigmatarchaeota archaeon]